MLTVVTPSPSSVAAIYGILLQSRFDGKEFKYLGGEFPNFVQRMPSTTMALFKWLREKMLPSPTKFHYTFTLKDLSRLFQGVLRTPKSTYTQDNVLVQLWRHEAERVFSDKLSTPRQGQVKKNRLVTNRCLPRLVRVDLHRL